VAVTGWLVDRTGTYFAGFALAAGVSAVGALVFGLLFEARPFEQAERPSPVAGRSDGD